MVTSVGLFLLIVYISCYIDRDQNLVHFPDIFLYLTKSWCQQEPRNLVSVVFIVGRDLLNWHLYDGGGSGWLAPCNNCRSE